MTDSRKMAQQLIDAERTRTPLTPFTRGYPFLSAEVAYETQWRVVERRLAGGEEIAGGQPRLTSRGKEDGRRQPRPARPGQTGRPRHPRAVVRVAHHRNAVATR